MGVKLDGFRVKLDGFGRKLTLFFVKLNHKSLGICRVFSFKNTRSFWWY
jgi:hypothetical protein